MGRVITDRARPEGFEFQVTCDECKSDQIITAGDMSYDRWKVSGYFFAGNEVIEAHYSFTCSACEFEGTFLEKDLIPVGIRNDLEDDYHARKAAGAMIL